MASDHSGLSEAMDAGTRHAENSSGDIASRVNSLIQEMTEDHKAVAGNTMPTYSAASTELTAAFDGLIEWCQTRGVDLSTESARNRRHR